MNSSNDRSAVVFGSTQNRIELALLKETCHIFDEPLTQFITPLPVDFDEPLTQFTPLPIDFDIEVDELSNWPFSLEKRTSNRLVVEEDKLAEQYSHDLLFNSNRSKCEKKQQQQVSHSQLDKKRKRGRPKKDASEGWPKRPLSAYNIFFQRERERLKKMMRREKRDEQTKVCNLSFTNLARTIASNWNVLSNSDKAPFEELANENRKRYRREVHSMVEKKQKLLDANNTTSCETSSIDHTLKLSVKVDNTPLKRRRGRPKRDPEEGWPKRPLSAYNWFFKEERERLLKSRASKSIKMDFEKEGIKKATKQESKPKKHGIISFVDLSRAVAIKWKEMTEEAKFPYKLQAEGNLIVYKREMKDFLSKRKKSCEEVIENSFTI